MDAMDILGSLLGGSSSGKGGGLSGKILGELLQGRASSKVQQPKTSSGSRSGGMSIEEHAKELEELLGVATNRQGRPPQRAEPPRYRPAPAPPTHRRREVPAESEYTRPKSAAQQQVSTDEQTIVLIRAMIAAAKADGRMTQAEQQAILGRLGNPTQETLRFLQSEFARSIDVRELAWSVPLGMEEQVYLLSLAVIDLDTRPEATYLRELSHGLRLPPERCNRMHAQLGAPAIF